MNEKAFELIVENMQETLTNNSKVFANYVLHPERLGGFTQKLMDAWAHADGENQRRLAIAFPQIAHAMIEYKTLPKKKAIKYLKKLLGEN